MKRVRRVVVVAWLCIGCLAFSPQVATGDVSGDPAEIGVAWVGDYSGTGFGSLRTPDDCVLGLKKIADDPATTWVWRFNHGDDLACATDWLPPRLGGESDLYCDNVDLVAYSGHGTGNCFNLSTRRDSSRVEANSMDLGVKDCEWVLAFTCNFLKGTWAEFGRIANGVHLVCGYATDMTVTANGGERFAYYAKAPYGVRVAWYKYGQATQAGANRNIARTFGADASYNDYLWRYGSVSPDPVTAFGDDSSEYSYWDTRLGW